MRGAVVSERTKTYASGAQSSADVARFDLVPRAFLERVARRFGVGAQKYGDLQYRAGLRDREYILDRMNHLQQHVQAYLAPQTVEEAVDDNLAAIGWAAAFLCEVEADRDGAKILYAIRAERGRSIRAHIKDGRNG